jgi:hypothetical protein
LFLAPGVFKFGKRYFGDHQARNAARKKASEISTPGLLLNMTNLSFYLTNAIDFVITIAELEKIILIISFGS